MDEDSKEMKRMDVQEIEGKLKQAEIELKDLNKAAELAFSVIKKKENGLLDEISELREELKKRGESG